MKRRGMSMEQRRCRMIVSVQQIDGTYGVSSSSNVDASNFEVKAVATEKLPLSRIFSRSEKTLLLTVATPSLLHLLSHN